MSAWVVSKSHIDAMVAAAMQLGSSLPGEPFGVYWNGRRTEVRRDTADHVGELLVQDIVEGVSHRYPNDDVSKGELPGPTDAYYNRPYHWQPTRKFTPGEIAKMIACYAYQACEHRHWEQTFAHAFCRTLEGRVLRCLEGHDDAPWGFDEDDVRTPAQKNLT